MYEEITKENLQQGVLDAISTYRNNTNKKPTTITMSPKTYQLIQQLCEFINHLGTSGRFMGMEIKVDGRLQKDTIIIS